MNHMCEYPSPDDEFKAIYGYYPDEEEPDEIDAYDEWRDMQDDFIEKYIS